MLNDLLPFTSFRVNVPEYFSHAETKLPPFTGKDGSFDLTCPLGTVFQCYIGAVPFVRYSLPRLATDASVKSCTEQFASA